MPVSRRDAIKREQRKKADVVLPQNHPLRRRTESKVDERNGDFH